MKEQLRELTFYEKYPDGLPLEILELIDFKHFGAILKQEQLLPPSYDRKPAEIKVYLAADNLPRVKLIFKSKTSTSFRNVYIMRNEVGCGINEYNSHKYSEELTNVWFNFAQNVMWAWERGYNYALVGPDKNIKTYRKLRVNEGKINKLKEIEDECQHFSYFKSN